MISRAPAAHDYAAGPAKFRHDRGRSPEGPRPVVEVLALDGRLCRLLARAFDAPEYRLLLRRVAQHLLQVLPTEHGRSPFYVLPASARPGGVRDEVRRGLSAQPALRLLVLAPDVLARFLHGGQDSGGVADDIQVNVLQGCRLPVAWGRVHTALTEIVHILEEQRILPCYLLLDVRLRVIWP